MYISELELTAMELATAKHEGQRRKYTGLPYIVHPAGVVSILRAMGVTDIHVLSAAWLHDVIEDCGVQQVDLEIMFGKYIAEVVAGCSSVTQQSAEPRPVRKLADMHHYELGDSSVHAIKTADIIHNTPEVVLYDPEFARVYLQEQTALWEALKKTPDDLRDAACDVLDKCWEVMAMGE